MSAEVQGAVRKLEAVKARDSARVRLTISHPSLTANEMSGALDLKASSAVVKGASIAPDHDKRIVAGAHSWTFRPAGKVKGRRVEEQLVWLLEQLEGRTPLLRSWIADGATISLSVFVDAHARLQSLRLDADLLDRLARLKIELDYVCHYQNTDAEY